MGPAPGQGSRLGERVLFLAALRGVSLNKLGEAGGIPSALISRWTRTTVHASPETLKRLADAWGVSFEWLACGTGPLVGWSTMDEALRAAVAPLVQEIAALRAAVEKLTGAS